MKKLILILLLFSPLLSFGAACPSTGWCKVLFGNSAMPNNDGWNHLQWSHDTGLFYYFGDNSGTGLSPFENTFWTYKVQSNTYSSYTSCDGGQACMSQFSSSGSSNGDTGNSGSEEVCLVTSMDATTVPSSIQVAIAGQGKINSQGWKVSANGGTLYFAIDDEVVSVTGCNSPGADCAGGTSGPITLYLSARGLRTGAGAVQTAHTGGASNGSGCSGSSPNYSHVAFAAPAPSYNGGAVDVTKDHPFDRHPADQNYWYEAATGKLWFSWGYVDSRTPYHEVWFDCIFVTSACPSLSAGWQRVPQGVPPWTANNNAQYMEVGSVTQNSTVLDPDDDVAFSYGGANGGSGTASDNMLWVFCHSANASVWVDSAHTCASTGYQGYWHFVTPKGGSAPTNEASRGDYDRTNHLLVYMGGCNSANCVTDIYYVPVIYIPTSGLWCNSDPAASNTVGGGNGVSNPAGCPSQFASANYPASGHPPAMKFAAWTFDNSITPQQFIYLTDQSPSQIYLWNAATNTWTLTTIGSGPDYSGAASLQGCLPGQSLAHDDINHQLVWINFSTCSGTGAPPGQLWQLPDATISSPPSNPIGSLSPTSMGFGNQFVNTTSASQSSTLTNIGNAALTITSISSSLGDYVASDNCPLSPSTLAAGSSCTITVTFTPSTIGSRPATINVNDNSGGSSVTQQISLSGVGVVPTVGPTTLDRGNTLERP